MTFRTHRFATLFGLLAVLSVPALNAHADLVTDLDALKLEANALHSHLVGIQPSADDLCTPLLEANRLARSLADHTMLLDDTLAAPLQVDAAMLDVLDELSVTGVNVATEALRLSLDVQTLSATAQALTLKDGIVAMLQLSGDIGTMANRIGAMADKILVMSDNIGLMADRILLTQELQNQNVALTTRSLLQTQTNMLGLVQVIEDSSYQLTLENLIAQGYLLAARMSAVMLNPFTMSTQLSSVADDVHSYLDTVTAAGALIDQDTATRTLYTTAHELVELGNLSLMLTSLAGAVDGYTMAIGGLQAFTSKPRLSASLKSMLKLSADIGVMANRVLEMADQILLMADNIGLQADQILATQQAMNVNVAFTQGAILGAQEMAIGIITARSL